MTDPLDAPPPPPAGPPPLTLWSPDGAIGFGWNVVKSRPETVLVGFLYILCSNALTAPGDVLEWIAIARSDEEALEYLEPLNWAIYALSLPVQAYLAMGFWRYSLKTARGQAATIGDLFSGGPFLAVFGAMLLEILGVLFGLALCIVPGVVLALGWWFFLPLALEGRLGPVESLTGSWRLTDGHKTQMFVLALFMAGVMLAGALACCVGVFVALPICQFASAYVYLRLTGQDVVEPS